MMLSTTRNFDQFGFHSHRWCCKCHWRHSRTLSPAAASLVVVGFFSSAMIVVGSINLLGVCYAENCHRLSSFLNESILVLLGILMVSNALTSLLILTSLVAAFFLWPKVSFVQSWPSITVKCLVGAGILAMSFVRFYFRLQSLSLFRRPKLLPWAFFLAVTGLHLGCNVYWIDWSCNIG